MNETRIYNPLSKDFRVTWLDDNNDQHIFIVPSLSIVRFPEKQARYVAKHLADDVANTRGRRVDIDAQLAEIMQEILPHD